MSSNWSREGQPQMGGNSIQQHSGPPPARRSTNPPPVCFNCGGEHFLVACPQSSNRATPAGFASAPVPYQQAPGPVPPSQPYPSQQSGPAQYSSYPQNQQYGAPVSQYQYAQPPQAQQPYSAPYTAPPPVQPYPRPGFQPTYNQQNQNNGPPQFNAPAYQPPVPQYNARGPSPYQPPVNNYPPPAQGTGYRGGYQSGPTPAPYHPPPTQWNNTPSSSQSPFQRPSRSNSGFKREFSGTPSHHFQQRPRSQSQQWERSAEAIRQTPQTPSSVSGKAQQVSYQGSPAKPVIASVPSTPASQSNIRRDSSATIGLGSVKLEQNLVAEKDKAEVTEEQETEEGEVCEGDEADELFEWEYKEIFKEPPAAETVALAQPLSAGYESTPVPLIQAWSTSVPSISRYARKDNLKEFMKSVRAGLQWDYLQEDPAYLEVSDEGALIPLKDIWAWMDVHHGRVIDVEEEVEAPEQVPRKRSRLEVEDAQPDDEQKDIDDQIAVDIATGEIGEEPPSKRQKNDEAEDSDEIMRSPGGRTPIISGRGGTPCMPTTDNAWAPQPGECATSPGDPTENLLASLGVSGDPKPVKQEPLPPYVANEEQSNSPCSSQTQTPVNTQQPQFQRPPTNGPGTNAQNVPQNMPQTHGPPMVPGPQNNQHFGPPINSSYGNGHMPNTQYGNGPPANNTHGPPQGPSQGPHQGQPQYGPPTSAPYGNGPPQNMQGPPYGPHVNAPYANGPPNSYPQGLPQWGPQQSNPYVNPPQYVAPQQYPQYGPPQNAPYANVPYGPPTNQYPSAPLAQYPQGPPQYNQARQPSYGSGASMPGQYGPMTQSSPTQYGPPQNIPYNAPYPNQPQYQNGPVAGYVNGPPNGLPNAPYTNMPPNQNIPANQPPYGNFPNGQGPPRQDSGYVSARGSYSTGSGLNGFNNQAQNSSQNPPQIQTQDQTQPAQGQPLSDAINKQGPRDQAQQPEVKTESSANSNESFESNENDSSPGTPLSPTSALILGKLERKPSKAKSTQNGDKDRPLLRKVKKRPQPVVAEAYSRRW